MPSRSTKQQGLMGQAYAIRKFQRTHGKEGLNPKDIPAEYRDDIKDVSKQMKLKSLKDFASTSHKGLPEEVEEELKVEDTSKEIPTIYTSLNPDSKAPKKKTDAFKMMNLTDYRDYIKR